MINSKLLLIGEYIAFDKSPGLGLVTDKYNLTYEVSKYKNFKIESEKKLNFEKEIIELIKKNNLNKNIKIKIKSSIPDCGGFGSSASFALALTYALKAKYKFEFAKSIESLFHFKSSGIDILLNIQKKGLYKIEFDPLKVTSLEYDLNFILIGKKRLQDTSIIIENIANLKKYDKNTINNIEKLKNISNNIINIVENKKDIISLGKSLTEAHDILKKMFLSLEEYDEILDYALKYGALGGKLTGAGKGGVMMILTKKENQDKIFKKLKKFTKDLEIDFIDIL